MPVTLADIDKEIKRREQLAAVNAELDLRSRVHWPSFRGAAAQLFALFEASEHPAELMVAGPAETGKTFACLTFVDRFARTFPGAQITIARKLRATMDGTVLNTWRRVIAIRGGVRTYGGERPQWYDYDNGSRVWIAGLDSPGKALSSERDLIYVNQSEDLELDDWQTLTTRSTGRGAVAPWTLLLGDCNPGPPSHWIIHRRSLKILESRHEDNPSLYTDTGELTAQGVRTMQVLDSLEGVLLERLRYGRWVAAEGVVYNFDRALHLVSTLPAGWHQWRKIRAFDFGFTNPFVCLWACVDPDGRLYIYRQLYMTGRTVDEHARQIKQVERWYITPADLEALEQSDRPADRTLAAQVRAQCTLSPAAAAELDLEAGALLYDEQAGWLVTTKTRQPIRNPYREKIDSNIADHDAEDRATLQAQGIITIPAKKDISPGIQALQRRLRKAGDGRARFFVLEGCLLEVDPTLASTHKPYSLEQEFNLYAWPKGADGKPLKEVPVKLFDHAMDTARYLVMHVDRLAGAILR